MIHFLTTTLLVFLITTFCSKAQNCSQIINNGDKALENNKIEEAISTYSEAIRKGCSVEAYLKRGLAYYAFADFERAIKDYDFVIDSLSLPTAYYYRATAYYQSGNIKKAERDFKKAIAKEKKASAMTGLGVLYNNAGKYKKAEQLLRSAIHIDPQYSLAYYNLSITFLNKKHYQEAIHIIQKGRKNAPDKIYDELEGKILLNQGKYEQAIVCFTKTLSVEPHKADVHFLRGNCYSSLGQKEKACSDWKRAIELGYMDAEKKYLELCK